MSAASPPPTRVRYGVLGFACSLAMITYLDRVCFSKAAPEIAKELVGPHGVVADLNWAIALFAFAYAIFEVPTGWLGDVFGPKRTLIRIVLWWSLFTALTGMIKPFTWTVLPWLVITGLTALAAIRFLFGVGEAGAFPNITRALHNWFPPEKRAFAQGMVWMAARLLGGLTPLVWLFITVTLGLHWRTTFYVFGVIGAIWCVAFWYWFHDRPRQHPGVNAAEVELIEAGRQDVGHAHANVPWVKLLTSGNLWLLCLMYFGIAYGWYFNITYLPEFLEIQYGVEKDDPLGQVYAGGPLLFGATTCLLGGLLSDWFVRRTGNRKWGRRLFGVIGLTLCASCYALCAFRPSLIGFFLAISFAGFWNDLTMGAAWATCQDIGRKHAAIVAGCMNTIGNLGSAAAGWIIGAILEARKGSLAGGAEAFKRLGPDEKRELFWPAYQTNFIIFAAVCFLAALLWFRIDATRSVIPEESRQPEAHG